MDRQEERIQFYGSHYDILGNWIVRPEEKVTLGDKANRVCRFCSKKAPDATFKKIAHAIPELLGNKSIFSAYECDDCNEEFGNGIENDLGNWSKPIRGLICIKGKRGVPTLKKQDGTGWRIEYDRDVLNIKVYEDDPIYQIDEVKQEITFHLKRDPYTPVAVLKAFMKIALTLLPDNEISNFSALMSWVRERDHQKAFLKEWPIIYTFQPGPMPKDLIAAFILRRKANVKDYAYAFLVFSYGNEVFQIALPCDDQEKHKNQLVPFPVPGNGDPAQYGETKTGLLHLTDCQLKIAEIVPISMHYESKTAV